jgi:hypothetical protein
VSSSLSFASSQLFQLHPLPAPISDVEKVLRMSRQLAKYAVPRLQQQHTNTNQLSPVQIPGEDSEMLNVRQAGMSKRKRAADDELSQTTINALSFPMLTDNEPNLRTVHTTRISSSSSSSSSDPLLRQPYHCVSKSLFSLTDHSRDRGSAKLCILTIQLSHPSFTPRAGGAASSRAAAALASSSKFFTTSFKIDGRKSFSNAPFKKYYTRGIHAAWFAEPTVNPSSAPAAQSITLNHGRVLLLISQRGGRPLGKGFTGLKHDTSSYTAKHPLLCLASNSVEYTLSVFLNLSASKGIPGVQEDADMSAIANWKEVAVSVNARFEAGEVSLQPLNVAGATVPHVEYPQQNPPSPVSVASSAAASAEPALDPTSPATISRSDSADSSRRLSEHDDSASETEEDDEEEAELASPMAEEHAASAAVAASLGVFEPMLEDPISSHEHDPHHHHAGSSYPHMLTPAVQEDNAGWLNDEEFFIVDSTMAPELIQQQQQQQQQQQNGSQPFKDEAAVVAAMHHEAEPSPDAVLVTAPAPKRQKLEIQKPDLFRATSTDSRVHLYSLSPFAPASSFLSASMPVPLGAATFPSFALSPQPVSADVQFLSFPHFSTQFATLTNFHN